MAIAISNRKECESAVLACLGDCEKITEHVYEGLKKVEIENDLLGTYEEVYRCSVCGALRRWGLISGSWKDGRQLNHPGVVGADVEVKRMPGVAKQWEW